MVVEVLLAADATLDALSNQGHALKVKSSLSHGCCVLLHFLYHVLQFLFFDLFHEILPSRRSGSG